jgi:hypothetical protein
VNIRRNTRTCFQCCKPGHFVVDCPEKVENKDGYKHKSRTNGKYRSRRDHKSKHKDEQRSRKKESRGKARAMVGASDVDLSSAYSTSSSSSSEDEGVRRKSRKSSKNLSWLSCFARDGFCTMVLSSGSKKSTQSDSDSDSDDEVCDEVPFLRQENERLGLLLDNRDDILREAKKMRKKLRASLEDARTRVAELETQNLDAKLETDSLKASRVVSDEVECADCPIFLANCYGVVKLPSTNNEGKLILKNQNQNQNPANRGTLLVVYTCAYRGKTFDSFGTPPFAQRILSPETHAKTN